MSESELYKELGILTKDRDKWADNIIKNFSLKHNKPALYFTETYILPDAFSKIDNECKMYMAFLVSADEAEYIKENGCEKFEALLEEKNADVIDIDRISVG